MNRISRGTNKRKKRFFKIIKILSLVVIIGITGTNFTYNKVSTAPVSDVAKATVKVADIKSMQRGNNQMFKRLYGLSADEFDGVRLYYPKTNMGAEEMLIIKLKDEEQKDSVREAIDKRRDTQLKNFDGYGTYQHGMLEKSLITVKGNYILFISGKHPEEVKHSFEKAL